MTAPHRLSASSVPAELLAERKTASVAVIVPAVDEAARIGPTIEAAVGLQERGVVDEVTVVDGGSADGTPELAAAAGVKVLHAVEIHPDLGPVLGKGDALWRALSRAEAEIVVFLDADLTGDVQGFLTGLVGPLILGSEIDFVKGAFHRIAPDGADPDDPFDGGRVTELMARPLLNLWRPDLAAFYQPLGGQVAGRIELLRSIPMLTGYAVEIAMLVDVVDRVGLDRVAEVDLGRLQNRPRSTEALAPMAQEVLFGFASRVLPPRAQPAWVPYHRPQTPAASAPAVAERPPLRDLSTEGFTTP